MDLELKDVHILVTGASGGIGLETASEFLKQGARVTAHYNTKREPLLGLLSGYGPGRIQAVQANLISEKEVDSLFHDASAAYGVVQVAVINHAIYVAEDIPVKDMSLEQWKTTLDVNLTSTFLVARGYLKQLEHASDSEKAKASLLFVGSSAAEFGEANHADYSASKSAMMYGLTRTLKNEIVKIAPKARVNCVAPGWTRTPMAEESLKDPNVVYRAMATTPLKKVAVPADVATQIVVMSSTRISGHVSGQVLMVAGGMEGRLLNGPQDIDL
ncbi:NAD-P-binding protein [Guyanagaster necrorhizus]|uniref:NAD-P-binding protein n=1 Tax=Guyanagaster necrorhizus TaxID=856835 RepID=A0A9P7VTY4_9AGAR|nr:NAD-P-binding protein [Guyanagaster necrorhizus MCA 3950]KAG7446517.1 NAD-P-binding protein [Guyanagaster necrorhizus MCA 3950]